MSAGHDAVTVVQAGRDHGDLADLGADWLVLPELAILELLSLEPHLDERDAVTYLLGYAETYEQTLAIYSRAFGVQVVGGSHFRQETQVLNTALVIERDGKKLTLTATPVYDPETQRGRIGIGFAGGHYEVQRPGPDPVEQFGEVLRLMGKTFNALDRKSNG